MRTLAIGDIHGCYRSLKRLASAAKISPNDQIVTLGDHIDRGPDSRGVLDWLIDRSSDGLIALRGNHESMILEARINVDTYRAWIVCGGKAVLASFETDDIEQIPERYWQFLEQQLKPYHATDTHIFVHANVFPELDLEDQPDFMLYWDSSIQRPRHESGRVIVCGHTPQRNGIPLDMGHAVCIDTAAAKGGWLTCLDVNSRYCWQANEQGDVRSFWLDEGPEM